MAYKCNTQQVELAVKQPDISPGDICRLHIADIHSRNTMHWQRQRVQAAVVSTNFLSMPLDAIRVDQAFYMAVHLTPEQNALAKDSPWVSASERRAGCRCMQQCGCGSGSRGPCNFPVN